MKKNIIILGLIFLLVVLCGDDFLIIYFGDSVFMDLVLSIEQDIDNVVNGLYDLMFSYGYYGGIMFFYGDMKGDDMQSFYNSGRICNWCYLYDYCFISLNVGYLWGCFFYIICNVWNVINVIDDGKV